MALYAAYDPSMPPPQRVTGWYDTGIINYGTKLPAARLEVTADQWEARLTDANGWAVQNGTLIPLAASSTSIPVSLRDQAKTILDNTDRVVLRCAEHAVPFPAAWLNYRNALRAIASGAPATALPVQPAFPEGT